MKPFHQRMLEQAIAEKKQDPNIPIEYIFEQCIQDMSHGKAIDCFKDITAEFIEEYADLKPQHRFYARRWIERINIMMTALRFKGCDISELNTYIDDLKYNYIKRAEFDFTHNEFIANLRTETAELEKVENPLADMFTQLKLTSEDYQDMLVESKFLYKFINLYLSIDDDKRTALFELDPGKLKSLLRSYGILYSDEAKLNSKVLELGENKLDWDSLIKLSKLRETNCFYRTTFNMLDISLFHLDFPLEDALEHLESQRNFDLIAQSLKKSETTMQDTLKRLLSEPYGSLISSFAWRSSDIKNATSSKFFETLQELFNNCKPNRNSLFSESSPLTLKEEHNSTLSPSK